MTAELHQFPCLTDNYGVLINDPVSGRTASVDAPDAGAVLAALDHKGWRLTDILVTHHHADHTQGIAGLRARFPDVRVVAPAREAGRIGGVDHSVAEGDVVNLGSLRARVMETPGHTAGHVVYWFEHERLLFAGDTLFAMGCGRVLETALGVMWESLAKLRHLPPDTAIYCGHEYTAANARFALSVDAGNAALVERATAVERLRADGRPTLPTTLAIELATNPFLRADHEAVKAAVGLAGGDPATVFAELRERKNKA